MKNSKNIVCFIVFFMFYASLLWGQTGRHETFKTNALNYLKQRSNQIRGSGAQQIGFSHRRTNIDNFGFGHSRFQVLYKGIPIFANVIIVHFDKSDNAVRYGGGKIPDMDYNLSVEPDLTAEAAIEIVRNQMDIGAQTNLLDTTLMIWDGKLIDPSLNSINLVWKVEMISSDPPGEWIYFIDAHSGQIVNFFNNIKFALNRKQYDLECCTYWNTSCYPGTFLFGEGGSSSDPDAQGVYENLKIVYDYFDLNHGRDSYDGGGATIISSVHVGDYYGNCGFQNAFWWGTIQQFGYGDGDKYAQVRDVVGHEFTHAVTDYTANLYYGYQPGAMNESFSDLFASLIDDDDWLMGEELNGGAIRSMEDPTLYNQPDHMDDYLNTSSDNGGVHTNSGIPNKAFHYIAKALIEKYGESGADNGWERAGKIYYYALENLLSEYSNFNNLRTAILNAANICYPDNEYIQDAISRSFAAVGIGDCDITLTGTLAQSETWDGFVPVIGDITIPAGKTLTIDPGTSIFFKSNHDYESSGYYSSKTEIIVNGILNVIGSENSMIKFTSIIDDPNLDDWGGIIINSGGSYTFDYVKMYGAYYGIKPNYTSGTISNSHFEQNYIGTYLYHANSSNIHNCEFIDNQYGTAALYSSNLNFQNNSYDSNDYYGIYFNRSTGTFKNNVIENNSIHGFYINNQCDVDMNTWFEYDDEPTINNTIQNNASDGMWIGDGDIDIGTYLNIGTDFRGGFNYFNHGSGYLDIRYRGDDDMKAEANWWKNMAIDWDFGEIDTDPTASSLGYSLPKSVNGSDSDYIDDLLKQAYYLEKADSNYVEAIDILNKAADIVPDDPIVQKIVLRLKRLYTKLSDKKGLLKNLDELYNTYPDQLIGITAYDHSVTLFADELNFDEALKRSNKLIEKYFNYSNSKEKNAWALLEQGMLYIDTKGKLSNNAQAQSCFTKILSDFSESEAAIILTELYDIEAPEKKKKEQIQNFSLLPPSPNPSNPSTTLKFILSEESKVSMVIYDIMGHEVWTLNNGLSSKYSKGYHSVVWHGVDNKGKPLASGMYIVVMITPNFRQSQKILLLK